MTRVKLWVLFVRCSEIRIPVFIFIAALQSSLIKSVYKYSLLNKTTKCIGAQVTAEGLTDAEAEAYSEFIENVTDNGHNHGLVVIAPHGGNIEKYTDEQAEHVGQKLSSKYVSEWICKGFDEGRGAFNRWHITSTDISEESFPKLKTIFGRYFEYSVAFHGWGGTRKKNRSICIGGTMKTTEPKTHCEI